MDQTQALNILKTGANVFLTGEPGSGKTYTINQYVSYLRSHDIEPAITASTGIAATHIGGMTIHSWSGIGIKNRLEKGDLHSIVTSDYIMKRIGKTKVLIIDEISMLPPETLGMIDSICRGVKADRRPFGGIQTVLVGDFFQLPPVVKSYTALSDEFSQAGMFDEAPARFAFDAPAWRHAEFTTCYLTEQYRQDDDNLVSILSKIRNNSFDDLSLEFIRQRKVNPAEFPSDAPKLYSHNVDVDLVNDRMLAKINKEPHFFPMATHGRETLVRTMKKGCLSPENLYLRVGAAVMFTKNNPKEGFVNGTLGTVVGFETETEYPIVQVRDGRKITVTPADWSVEEEGKVKGKLTQIPLRLAWAITVHKSQGISLDEAVIDLSRVFEFGQGYVAISRVRRLSGIYILGWNKMAFQVDAVVLEKDADFHLQSEAAEKQLAQFSDEKFRKMSDDFITSCDGELETSEVLATAKKSKVSTLDETLRLWQSGIGIEQIAKARKLNSQTIINHIEKLIQKGKIEQKDLARILPQNVSLNLPEILKIFKKLETTKLSPVLEYFKGKYSYDDLKLARMMIE